MLDLVIADVVDSGLHLRQVCLDNRTLRSADLFLIRTSAEHLVDDAFNWRALPLLDGFIRRRDRLHVLLSRPNIPKFFEIDYSRPGVDRLPLHLREALELLGAGHLALQHVTLAFGDEWLWLLHAAPAGALSLWRYLTGLGLWLAWRLVFGVVLLGERGLEVTDLEALVFVFEQLRDVDEIVRLTSYSLTRRSRRFGTSQDVFRVVNYIFHVVHRCCLSSHHLVLTAIGHSAEESRPVYCFRLRALARTLL